MSGAYERVLEPDRSVVLHVEYENVGRDVVGYSVVLTVVHDGRQHTVRVYDAAHGHNEMHRYTLAGGKQPGQVVHAGSLGEGMRAAITECARGYRHMIEAWMR
jgi:hypothetical protein